MKDFWLYDFTSLTAGIENWLQETFSPFWAVTWEMVIIGLAFLLFYAVTGLVLVYAERRICAFMQNRLGPNRVGPWGLLQTIADFIKLLMKELVHIKEADKFLFNLAPFIVIIASFMAIAAIPFAKGLHAIDFGHFDGSPGGSGMGLSRRAQGVCPASRRIEAALAESDGNTPAAPHRDGRCNKKGPENAPGLLASR